ncbi:MAG: ABC transporter substrate-binding protein [Gammaproteobacteria bacterium]
MGKKITILAIAFAIVAFTQPTYAQQVGKVYRIGFLSRVPPQMAYLAGFHQGMGDQGHVEGKTYVLIPGWGKSGGKREKLAVLAGKLVTRSVDLIVTAGWRAARAANRAAPKTPIVMASSADPVRTGLIKSLAAPGGNITGMTSATVDIHLKRMEILKQLVPGLRRIAEIRRDRARAVTRQANPLWSAVDDDAARVLGIEFVRFQTNKADDFDALFRRVTGAGAGAIIVRSINSFSTAHRRRLVQAALAAKLPSILTTKQMVKMGGLASFGPSQPWMYRRAATYVDKILKGAKPADLPVERPTRFEFVINLKTAKALEIKIPRAILLRADEVIE